MEQTIVETAPSTMCERSNEHKEKKRKKRKSSANVVDCSSQPDDISLQKRSRCEGDLSSEDRKSNAVDLSLKAEVTLSRRERRRLKKENAGLNAGSNCNPGDNCSEDKSHFGGDLSLSHTSDVSTQANAEVSSPQTKENGKDGKEMKLAEKGKSQASQGGESDILNESCKIEITPLALSNQSMEYNAKRRKKSKKRNSSISNADSNCNPDQVDAEVSQMPRKEINKAGSSHVDREAGDGIVIYDSNTASHNASASEDIKSNAASPSLKTEVNLSTIRQGKGEGRRERKRQKRKNAILNAGSNCNPEDSCLKDKSHFGGDLSLSNTSDASTQRSAIDVNCSSQPDDISLQKRSRCEGDLSSEDRKSNAVALSLKAEVTLSRRERRRLKKENAGLNAGSNCNPGDICSEDKSHFGGDLSLSHTSDVSTQANAEVSNLQTKENGKDGKEGELAKKGKSHASQGGELDILNEACKIQIAPSVLSNQSMEHNAKKRKKSKKRNSSISNADSNCNPDQADAEVSQMQRKESIKGNSNIASQSCNIETAPSTICDQSKEQKTKKRKRKKSRKIDDSISNAQSNCDPAISFREKSSFGGAAALDQSCVSSDVILPSLVVKEPKPSNRKLLILDLNGLLADIVKKPSKFGYPNYKPHTRIGMNGVFTRPFCDEFLQFCLETFDVGVWSSRMRGNVELIVHCLFGDRRNRLLFCWDGSHCTQTGCQTPGKKYKPLVLKELKKFWGKGDPGHPWKEGDYNESNTLLIDDSPCKAVCNPPYTGIFPHPYKHTNLQDNSLGPNGELRLYLERLATADNVQRFVAENPIGQRAITNKHPNWTFYSKIIEANRSKVL